MTTKPKYQFYSEAVYAPAPSVIPVRFRKEKTIFKTYPLRKILGEAVRADDCVQHIAAPKPDEVGHHYGIAPAEFEQFAQTLEALSARNTETYSRKGKNQPTPKTHTRKQKATTPVLLGAVASFPGKASDPDWPKFVALFVEAAEKRWGGNLRSIISHPTDEAYPHCHAYVCFRSGQPVKELAMAWKASIDEQNPSRKGNAYRDGGRALQQWAFESWGKAMGWAKTSPSPRQRLSRSQAQALRQENQEAEALELTQKGLKLLAQEKQLIANLQKLLEQKTRLAEREARLLEQQVELDKLRSAVKDQRAIEERLGREKYQGASYWD